MTSSWKFLEDACTWDSGYWWLSNLSQRCDFVDLKGTSFDRSIGPLFPLILVKDLRSKLIFSKIQTSYWLQDPCSHQVQCSYRPPPPSFSQGSHHLGLLNVIIYVDLVNGGYESPSIAYVSSAPRGSYCHSCPIARWHVVVGPPLSVASVLSRHCFYAELAQSGPATWPSRGHFCWLYIYTQLDILLILRPMLAYNMSILIRCFPSLVWWSLIVHLSSPILFQIIFVLEIDGRNCINS